MAIRADDVDLDRDAALVERFQTGDEEAFADLYRRYFGRLRRYCLRRLGDTHDAEEAAQEALVRAYRALPTFSGDKRFYPWLRVIASNLCNDICKRKPPAAPWDPDRGDVVVESVFEVLDRQQVQAVLEDLNPRHQAALSLWAEGYQSREIAEELGCSRGAVDVTLHRARQSFRRRFLAATGDGKLGMVGILPAFARFAERLRVRVGTRVAEYSELASPLAAKVAASAIAITVVGGASAAASSAPAAPKLSAPAPVVVNNAPAAVVPSVSPSVPASSGASVSAASPSAASATVPTASTPAVSSPTKSVGPVLFTTNEDAEQRSKDNAIQVVIAGVRVAADPNTALERAGQLVQGKS